MPTDGQRTLFAGGLRCCTAQGRLFFDDCPPGQELYSFGGKEKADAAARCGGLWRGGADGGPRSRFPRFPGRKGVVPVLDVRPFRGFRYTTAAAPRLDMVVSPPYDVISPEERERLAAQSPHNVVRIDLPTETDPEGSGDQYERSAALWRRWVEEGVVHQEDEPAFYAYRQEYDPGDGSRRVRWGLMGQVRIAAYEENIVYPHERTLRGPKEDRLRLTRATRLNLSPVFGLAFGAQESLDDIMVEACQGDPAGHVVDADGVDHKLWVLTDPGVRKRIQDALEPARIVIADGHHRYETAWAYRDERQKEAGPDVVDQAWHFVLMVIADMESPGLTVLPTHRILRNVDGFSAEALVERLNDSFTVTEVAASEANMSKALMAALESLGDAPGFALYAGQGRGWLARANDWQRFMGRLAPERSEAWRRLDVAVLHTGVVEAHLGLDAQAQASGQFLDYTRSAAEAVQAVDEGRGQAAFLLRATSPQEVRDVALAGDSMPQKSTYFYPKLLTGLVFRDLEEPVPPRA